MTMHLAVNRAAVSTLLLLVLLIVGLSLTRAAAISCPSVPPNAVSIAAVFGSSTLDAAHAAAVLGAALSSANASALYWAPTMRFYENQARVGWQYSNSHQGERIC